MTETKFKAWDTKENFFHAPMTMDQIVDLCCRPDDSITTLAIKFKLTRANLIFVQWTGLKDRNGKEIYEGDVLKYEAVPDGYPNSERREFKEVIRWDDMNKHTTLWAHFKNEYEIIGNIYENPELL